MTQPSHKDQEISSSHAHNYNSGNPLWCGFCGRYKFEEEIETLKRDNERMRWSLERIIKLNNGMAYGMEFEQIAKEALESGTEEGK